MQRLRRSSCAAHDGQKERTRETEQKTTKPPNKQKNPEKRAAWLATQVGKRRGETWGNQSGTRSFKPQQKMTCAHRTHGVSTRAKNMGHCKVLWCLSAFDIGLGTWPWLRLWSCAHHFTCLFRLARGLHDPRYSVTVSMCESRQACNGKQLRRVPLLQAIGKPAVLPARSDSFHVVNGQPHVAAKAF